MRTKVLISGVGLAAVAAVAATPLLASDELDDIPVRAYSKSPYDRGHWGRWRDADRDCQGTRQEVLIAESLEPVVLDKSGCRVISGKWRDPYTDTTYTDPRQLDIDHMVPLGHAHAAGGHAWHWRKRRQFVNDLDAPEHLIAVSSRANRSKGDRAPHKWLPPNQDYHCDYLHNWVAIKRRWKLAMSPTEAEFIGRRLRDCPP